MSLQITEMFDGIKSGQIELQQFHDWLCEPLTAPRELSDDEIITRYRELMSRSSI